MNISGYSSLMLDEVEELERIRKLQMEQKLSTGSQNSVFSWGMDTVSISPEAQQLFQASQASVAVADMKLDQDSADDLFAKDDFEGAEEIGLVENGGGGAGGGNSSTSTVEQIKKQIEVLSAKVQATAASSLPDNVKQSTIAAYEAEISELTAQLAELQKSEAA